MQYEYWLSGEINNKQSHTRWAVKPIYSRKNLKEVFTTFGYTEDAYRAAHD